MANGPSCATLGLIAGMFALIVVIGTVLGLIPLYIQSSSSTAGKTSASVNGGPTSQTSSTGRSILGRAVTVNGNSINTLPNYETSAKNQITNVLMVYSLSFIFSYTYTGSVFYAAPYFSVYSANYALTMDTLGKAVMAAQQASGSDTVGTATITSWSPTSSCTFTITGFSAATASSSNYQVSQYTSCAYSCGSAQPTNPSCISSYIANSTQLAALVTTPMNPTTAASGSGR